MVTEAPRQSTSTRPAAHGLTGFFKRLAQYYAEFLSTDFKKQRLPRRRLENTDAKGRLVGIPLRKYAGFQQKLWQELASPIGSGLSLAISRGSWRAALPKAVSDAIAAHINQVTQAHVDAVIAGTMAAARRLAERKGDDPDIAFERFGEEIRAGLARQIIAPLLDRMEGFFARTENKPIESLRELEDQLSTRLANGVETSSGAAFSTLLVEGNSEPLESLLCDQLAIDVLRAAVTAFFTGFTAADLYVELSDLTRSSRLIENVEFYLHIGEVHHASQVYPIFYIPFTAERDERGFKISSEPRVYINKRAMDYVAQEVAKAEERASIPSVIRDRIFYLSPDQSTLGIAQQLLDDMAGGFNLRAEINLREPRDQKVGSLLVTVTNRLSFSLFDRSDESMVNDYEAMITGLETGGDVAEFFKSLIDDFLLHNPISVRADVNREWDDMPLPERLVFDSPLPLVEEQRKILSAIRHPDSHFIAVEGPPGTGKSHTITAVAFNTILSGKSLLVLSDKKEALDVVEDKLNQALAKVRPSKDFPNPILRLGKGASNYSQLLKKSAIERLQVSHRAGRHGRAEREQALERERKSLQAALESATDAYSRIEIQEIASIESEVAQLSRRSADAAIILKNPDLANMALDVAIVADHVRSNPYLATVLRWRGERPGRLDRLSRVASTLARLQIGPAEISPVIAFSVDRLRALDAAIKRIQKAAIPVFGYLFAAKKLREIAGTLQKHCGIPCDRPHRELAKLESLRDRLLGIHETLAAVGLEADFEPAVVLIVAKLAGPNAPPLAPPGVIDASRRLEKAFEFPMFAPARERFYAALLEGESGPLAVIEQVGALKRREARIRQHFQRIPEIDYLGAKSRLESLNTLALAERIDERLIEFYDTKKNDALALGKIIREKQRFPVEKFPDIQRAFPCIIAGLRDYAEFIPLEREIFDLVVIDEASQVSIAQALPAMIRAKKVLVLGDPNQFGNVKTSNASHEVNSAYMKDLLKTFAAEFPAVSAAVRTKIDLFNIRSSVLDFVEHLSNFAIQLRKHFRSYPEMISFSSHYFYQDSLQVMKIRGKAVEDVIEFDVVQHDGLLERRNVNDPEAKRIIERVVVLLDEEKPPSVGVITPHTEQQAHIAKLVQDHPRVDEIYEKLRLKVMTFDTCQGEEREVIFYSLVATKEKDRLAYIFPRELEADRSDEIDHSLRLQRLNVGLSRAQEKIVFVHSKPVEDYASALRVALAHYRSELERAKALPDEEDVDESSPMERKVLHWLSQAPILRELDGVCEVIAQFELGKYLKQLDPNYHHPEYRVDFLIRVADGDTLHQMALEYDGFEFHFSRGVPAGQINDATWRSYLTADDLEREKVLESFGVQMIRLNRFNLGDDPVGTIDELLRKRLDGMLNGRKPHDLVSELAEKSSEIEEGLRSGEYKRCKKCDRDLPLSKFRDRAAKSGYRHRCDDCKASDTPKTSYPRFRRYSRWRR
jgi:hypothetical protein